MLAHIKAGPIRPALILLSGVFYVALTHFVTFGSSLNTTAYARELVEAVVSQFEPSAKHACPNQILAFDVLGPAGAVAVTDMLGEVVNCWYSEALQAIEAAVLQPEA